MSKRWDRSGVMTSVLLAGWAAAFWFLMLSGRWALYLSSRTYWVVPLGASILTLGALGRLVAARGRETRALEGGDRWKFGIMAIPVIAVLALPPSTLGPYAASRRAGVGGAGVAASGDAATGPITFLEVAQAPFSPDLMRALVKRAGEEVSLVGFVDRDAHEVADEFTLTQFVITCCINDALVARVRVVDAPPGKFGKGDWVRVTGPIYPVSNEFLLEATKIRPIPRPEHPYLTP